MTFSRILYNPETTKSLAERRHRIALRVAMAFLFVGVVVPPLFCAVLWVLASDPALAVVLKWCAAISGIVGGVVAVLAGQLVVWAVNLGVQILLALESIDANTEGLGVAPDVTGESRRRVGQQGGNDLRL